ncbi:MAG: hypothetical protein HY730_07460, partial [Candidatus Tectomicrobia bacterium]|nr:hypothetical protein [Candidatus Tectomicrobia bacterium]
MIREKGESQLRRILFPFKICSLLMLVLFVLSSCGAPTDPLLKLKAKLDREPEYSIILDDMKEEGTFFRSYYHKYRTIKGDSSNVTDWEQVSEEIYRKRGAFLGLALITKAKDGQYAQTPAPPGYHMVGNPAYGEWRRDASGNSFWEFYGKYRLFSDLLGAGSMIFRRDYNDYHQYRERQQPYFGRNKEFGTSGHYTERTNPSFFERRRAKIEMSKSKFAQRVASKAGRSSGSFRGGGGSF